MEVKRTNTIEEIYNLEDLISCLVKNEVKNTRIVPVYKTQVVPGYDPRDADYIDVFAGVKIIYNE